ncbi:hypothetical protein QE152_g31014 [Popillia japonica]|uniref:Sleeping Beauty transposase HTH domain-containing protein n=1 Tax=Popillia japonica TaxID=7064 RepID=A0AAW1JCK8_POPJA
MTRGKPLSEDMRHSIVSAHRKGHSGRSIAKMFSIPRGTVRNIITQFKNTGAVNVKVKTGRTSNISPRDQRALQSLIKKDRRVGSRELAAECGRAIGKSIAIFN